mgnify:CR=1 FL=1
MSTVYKRGYIMSKKRTKVKMYWKKQKFASFFLKIFVPFILAASVLGAIVTYLLVATYNKDVDDSTEYLNDVFMEAEDEALKAFGDSADGKAESAADYDFQTTENAFAGRMEYYCSINRIFVCDDRKSRDGMLAVYHRDSAGNLTKIASSDGRVFIAIEDAEGKTYYLSCTYEEYKEMSKDAYKLKSPSNINLKEVYVKDNNFWAGKYTYIDSDEEIRFVKMEDGTTDIADNTVYTAVNDNIPDGYVKLDMSKGFDIFNGYYRYVSNLGKMDTYEKVDELIDEASEEDSDSIQGYAERDYKCSFGHHTTEVDDLGGGYFIVSDFHTNFWRSMAGLQVIATWTGIILLCVIVSLAIAYAMYKTYLSAYDMEQYRRATSNAMAHDLNSPLAVIQLSAENLRDGTDPEKKRYYMDNIIDEVHQMNTQIASILDMAKVEDANTQLNKTDVDVASIVNSLAGEYAERIHEKDVTMDIKGTCMVHADEILMTKAIKNVMDNAVRYVTDGGEIKVRLSDSFASFVNSSEPLDEETLANVWEPFVKGDNSRHGHKGTGLGLPIVRTIMDRHGFACLLDNSVDGVEVRLTFK